MILYYFFKGSPFNKGSSNIITLFSRGRTSTSGNFRMENVMVRYQA